MYTHFAVVFKKHKHGVITHKIHDVGKTAEVERWIYSFLKTYEHVNQVMFEATAATDCSSGECAVLAPHLFLIYISDIDTNTNSFISFQSGTRMNIKIPSVENTEKN